MGQFYKLVLEQFLENLVPLEVALGKDCGERWGWGWGRGGMGRGVEEETSLVIQLLKF